jgi:hypothetical protein
MIAGARKAESSWTRIACNFGSCARVSEVSFVSVLVEVPFLINCVPFVFHIRGRKGGVFVVVLPSLWITVSIFFSTRPT